MQFASARQLYHALHTAQGPFIEKHKLSAIVKKFQEYQKQVKQQFKQNSQRQNEGNALDGIDQKLKKVHDEL